MSAFWVAPWDDETFTEEEQARDRCPECGEWGNCLDQCPLFEEQVRREDAAIEAARLAIIADVRERMFNGFRKRVHPRPERFCPQRKCLWKTGGGHCPRHINNANKESEHGEQAKVEAATQAGGQEEPQGAGNGPGRDGQARLEIRSQEPEEGDRARLQHATNESVLSSGVATRDLVGTVCGACGVAIRGAPYATVTGEHHESAICGEACIERYADIVMKRNLCTGCGSWCPPDDRQAVPGGIRCAACSLKLTHAYGFELSSVLRARGMGTVRGGRS